jgi:hypothetical protein
MDSISSCDNVSRIYSASASRSDLSSRRQDISLPSGTPPVSAEDLAHGKDWLQNKVELAQKDKGGTNAVSRIFQSKSEREWRERKPEFLKIALQIRIKCFAEGAASGGATRKKVYDTLMRIAEEHFSQKDLVERAKTYIEKKFGASAEMKHGAERVLKFSGNKVGGEFFTDGTTLKEPIIRSGNLSFYQLRSQEKLGEGAGSAVYRGMELTQYGDVPVAIKSCPFPLNEQAENELGIFDQIPASEHTSKKRDIAQLQSRALLVMDLAEHGSCNAIQYAISTIKDDVERTTAQRSLARGYINAVMALHGNNPPIYHLDISAQNFLLTADGRIILCDFGLSCTDHASVELEARDMHMLGLTLSSMSSDSQLTELGQMLMDHDIENRPRLDDVLEMAYFKDQPVLNNVQLAALAGKLAAHGVT